MMMLFQASQTEVPENNDELIEYLNELREGILDAYTGIINGLNDGQVIHLMVQPEDYMKHIFPFLQKVAYDAQKDEAVIKGAVGLIGDMAKCLQGHVKIYIHQAYSAPVASLLQVASEFDPELVKYASDEIQKIPYP